MPRRSSQRAVPFAAAALLAACAASDPMQPVRDAYSAGDYPQAQQLAEAVVAEGGGDVHVWQLEQGMCELAVQRPDPALTAWRAARDRLDSLQGRDTLESVASWLTDETALDYEGAAYEHTMVRAMLAVAELAAPDRMFGDDAIAYANQVGEVQSRLIDELTKMRDELGGKSLVPPDAPFKFVAFGSLIVAMIREADPTTVDEARFQIGRALELEPGNDWLQQEAERLRSGRFAAPGKGVVNVLGMVGRGPFKVADQVEATRQAFQLAEIIIAIQNRTVPQISIRGLPIDRLSFHQDNPDALRVSIDGQVVGDTVTVTDVEEVARREHEATKDARVARALVRRIIKVATTEASRAVVRQARNEDQKGRNTEGELLDVGIAVLGSLWQATEVADLRCWSLLPARCQALRVELDPGVHTLTVAPLRGGRPSGPATTMQVRVNGNRPSYVVALAPTDHTPVPLLSRAAVEAAGIDADLHRPEPSQESP
ncbi:MAG: hypothetical protein H6835_05900 [Planctomycetes bacterium]|nr:hypothetical protein [Planctomycetota bacterium]